MNYLSINKVVERIKNSNGKIVIYGAGMIGQIVVPWIVEEYDLLNHILFYVDNDIHKQGLDITILNKSVSIKTAESLKYLPENTIIFLTNSNYTSIISYFCSIRELDDVDLFIVPVWLAERAKNNNVDTRLSMHEKSVKEMIPRKIHYCWFSGKEMPAYLVKCMDSWKRFCPDYEIVRWDENNYDIEKYAYMKDAYAMKKWGFVPDIARLDILYNHGGIYIDTDVELIRNLDSLLSLEAFAGVEKWGSVNMGGCSGAVPKHPMIKRMLDFRKDERFIREDGSMNLTTCGYYETTPLMHMGFKPNNTVQNIGGMTIFSSDFFHPYDYMSGETYVTENTYSIHHFNGGWLDEKNREEREKTRKEYQHLLQLR